MYIKELYLSNYGCHNDKKLEFEPGFNLILKPNEWGKSTFVDAINAIYNGFNKKNEKYISWATNTIDLSAKFNLYDEEIDVNRSLIGNVKNGSIYRNNTQSIIKNKDLSSIVENKSLLDKNLWLVDEDTKDSFEVIVKKPEFSNLLLSSVSNNIDFDNLDSIINNKLKELYTNSSVSRSKIHKVSKKIQELEKKLSFLQNQELDLNDDYNLLKKYNENIEILNSKKENLKFLKDKYMKILDLIELKTKRDNLYNLFDKNNKEIYDESIDIPEINDLNDVEQNINNIKLEIKHLNNDLEEYNQELENIKNLKINKIQSIGIREAENKDALKKEKEAMIENAKLEDATREEIRESSKIKKYTFFIMTIIIVIVFLITLLPNSFLNLGILNGIWKFFVFPILIAICLVSALKYNNIYNKNESILEESIRNIENMKKFQYEDFNIEDDKEIIFLNKKFESYTKKQDETIQKLSKLNENINNLLKKKELVLEKMFQNYGTYDIEELKNIKLKFISNIKEYKLVLNDFNEKYERFKNEYDDFDIDKYNNEYFIQKLEDIQKNLLDVSQSIENNYYEIGKIDSSINSFDSNRISFLEDEILVLKKEKQSLQNEYDKFLFTKEVIDRAKQKIINDTQPIFINIMNNYVKKIDNISIDKFVVDTNKNLLAKNNDGKFGIEYDSLSISTKIVLLILLKIAILDEIDEKYMMPFVIDGAIDFLDKNRKENVYNILREVAKYRQVIVFQHS